MKISFLYGISFSVWCRLLWRIKYAFPFKYLPKIFGITCFSIVNSSFKFVENFSYQKRIEKTPMRFDPIFILGHWRSGTTHLQYILSQDSRFATANTYQVLFPSTFLLTETLGKKILEPFVPQKRPQDNMSGGLDYPNEDEIALGVLTGFSPYLSWPFPQHENYFQRYFTLEDISLKECQRWKKEYFFFLKKLTFKYKKPLIIKSPGHTYRIKLLLELFPSAKFVHIYRHPYAIYPSVQYLYETWQKQFDFLERPDFHFLQNTKALQERIGQSYTKMYDRFFLEVALINPENYHEICYEELEKQPMIELKKIYEHLHLPPFSEVESSFNQYLASVADYQKISHNTLTPETKDFIAKTWKRNFEKWGYASV